MLNLIADDLTGALDSAVSFARRGHTVAVAVSIDALDQAIDLVPSVLAVNTDSRDLDHDAASSRIASVARSLRNRTPCLQFKKVDSRLKGPIAAEISALAEGIGVTHVLACPAVPSIGRFVRNGQIVGFGVDRPIDVASALPSNLEAIIPDVTASDHLTAPVKIALEMATPPLFVGAAGLAEAMAEVLPRADHPARVRLSGPVLMVVSSRDPITVRQIATLRQARPDVQYVPAQDGIADLSSVGPQRAVLLHATGRDHAPAGREVAETVAQTAMTLASRLQARILFACGGDTALAVTRALGVGILKPLEEVIPGVPLCSAEGDAGALEIATKSGGFGEADALVRVLERLER